MLRRFGLSFDVLACALTIWLLLALGCFDSRMDDLAHAWTLWLALGCFCICLDILACAWTFRHALGHFGSHLNVSAGA